MIKGVFILRCDACGDQYHHTFNYEDDAQAFAERKWLCLRGDRKHYCCQLCLDMAKEDA